MEGPPPPPSSSTTAHHSSTGSTVLSIAKKTAFWSAVLAGAGFIYQRDLKRRSQGLPRRAPVEVVSQILNRFDYKSTKKAAQFILLHRTTAYVAGGVALLVAAKYALYLARISKRFMRSFNPSPQDALTGDYPGANDPDDGGAVVVVAEGANSDEVGPGERGHASAAGGGGDGTTTSSTTSGISDAIDVVSASSNGEFTPTPTDASSGSALAAAAPLQRAFSEPAMATTAAGDGDSDARMILPPRRLEQGEIERFVRLMRHIVQGLSYDAIMGIYGRLDRIKLKAGDVLFKQGSLALDGMYVVVQGELGMGVPAAHSSSFNSSANGAGSSSQFTYNHQQRMLHMVASPLSSSSSSGSDERSSSSRGGVGGGGVHPPRLRRSHQHQQEDYNNDDQTLEPEEEDFMLLCSFGKGQTVGENALLASMAFSHKQQCEAAAAAVAGSSSSIIPAAASADPLQHRRHAHHGATSAGAALDLQPHAHAQLPALSVDCTRPLSCIAVRDTVVLRLDATVFRAFIDSYPHAITSFIMTTTTRQWRVAFYLLVDFFRLKDAWVASLEAPAHAPAFAFFDEVPMHHHHQHHSQHQAGTTQPGIHFYGRGGGDGTGVTPHAHHGHGYGAASIFQQHHAVPPVGVMGGGGLRKAPSAVNAAGSNDNNESQQGNLPPPRHHHHHQRSRSADNSSGNGTTLLRYPPPIPTNLRQFRSCCSAVLLKQPGETVYTEGSDADAVYVVLSGEGVCTVAEKPNMVGPLLFSRQGYDPAESGATDAAAGGASSEAHVRHFPVPPAAPAGTAATSAGATPPAVGGPSGGGFVVRHIGPGCIAGGQACFVGLPHRDTLTAITLMEVAVFPRSLFNMLASNALPEWHSPARTTTLASVALAVARSLVPLLRMFLGLGLQRLWLRSGEVLYRAGQHARDGLYVVVSGRLRTFLPQGGKASGRVGPTVAERAGVLEDGRLPWERLQAQGLMNAGPVPAAQQQAQGGSSSSSTQQQQHQAYFSRLAVQQRVFESDEVASADDDDDEDGAGGDDDEEEIDHNGYYTARGAGHHDYDQPIQRSNSSISFARGGSSKDVAGLSAAGRSGNGSAVVRSRGHSTIIRGRSRFGAAGGPPHWSRPLLLHPAASAPALPLSTHASPNTSAVHNSSVNASKGRVDMSAMGVPLPDNGRDDDEDGGYDREDDDDDDDEEEEGGLTSPSADSTDNGGGPSRGGKTRGGATGNSKKGGLGVRFDPPSPTTTAAASSALVSSSGLPGNTTSTTGNVGENGLSVGRRSHLTATVGVPGAGINSSASSSAAGGAASPSAQQQSSNSHLHNNPLITPNLSFTRGFDVGRGDMVGEMSVLLQEKKRTDTAVCVRDCELICVSQAAFDLISSRYPAVARHFSQALARRYQELVGRSGGVAEGTAVSLTSNGARGGSARANSSGAAGAGGVAGGLPGSGAHSHAGNFAASLSSAAAGLAANAISQAYYYIQRPIAHGNAGGPARGPGHRGAGGAYNNMASPARGFPTIGAGTGAGASSSASAIPLPQIDDSQLKEVATTLMESSGESISSLRLPPSKTASPIITIAIAPAGTVLAAIPEFTIKLVAALERMGEGPVLHLTAAKLDAALGEGTSYQLDDLLVRARVGSWLSVQEERHRFIVFETDAPLPPQNPNDAQTGNGGSTNSLSSVSSTGRNGGGMKRGSSTLMRASSTVLDLAKAAVVQSFSGATSGVAAVGRGIDSALKAGLGVSPSMLFGPLQQQFAANGGAKGGMNGGSGSSSSREQKAPRRSTHWSELCIQQADLCLLVGKAHTPADLSPIEQECVYKVVSSSSSSASSASGATNAATTTLSPISTTGSTVAHSSGTAAAAHNLSSPSADSSKGGNQKRKGGGRSGLPSNPFSSAADLLAMRNGAASKELAALSRGAQPRRGVVEAAAAAARKAELERQPESATPAAGSAAAGPAASGHHHHSSTVHALSSRTFAVKELVLLHNDPSKRPSGTRDWLRRRRVTWHHHIRTPYEGDFDRIARHICGKARGLVLGGGGSRGLAHLGVLQVLQDRGVGIDVIGGTSQGAFMAACYATTLDVKSCFPLAKRLADTIGNSFNLVTSLTLPIMSYFSGASFNDAIIDCFKDVQIEDCWIRYFCVSTDVANDCSMVHQTGPLWRYCRASMTVLGLLPPLVDSRTNAATGTKSSVYLIDGGYTNNLPVDVMRSIAPRVNQIIATDVENKDNTLFEGISDYGDSISGWYIAFKWLLSLLRLSPPLRIPPLSEVSLKVSYISHSMQIRQLLQHNDDSILYIRPDVGQRFKLLDYHLMPTIVECGMIAAKETLEKWDARQLAKTYRELKKMAKQHLNAAMQSAHHQALMQQQQQALQTEAAVQGQARQQQAAIRGAGAGVSASNAAAARMLPLRNIGADTPTTVFAVSDPSQFYHNQQQQQPHNAHNNQTLARRMADEDDDDATATTTATTNTANTSLNISAASGTPPAHGGAPAAITFTLLSAMNGLQPNGIAQQQRQPQQQQQSAPLHISAPGQQQQSSVMAASNLLYPQMPQQLHLQQSPHPLLGSNTSYGASAAGAGGSGLNNPNNTVSTSILTGVSLNVSAASNNNNVGGGGAVSAVPFVPSVQPSVSVAPPGAAIAVAGHARQPSAFPANAAGGATITINTPPSISPQPTGGSLPSGSPPSAGAAATATPSAGATSALPLQVQRLRHAGSTGFNNGGSTSTIGGDVSTASASSSTNSLALGSSKDGSSTTSSSGGGTAVPGSPSRGASNTNGRLSVTIPFQMTTSASPHFGASSNNPSLSGAVPPLTPRLGGMPASAALQILPAIHASSAAPAAGSGMMMMHTATPVALPGGNTVALAGLSVQAASGHHNHHHSNSGSAGGTPSGFGGVVVNGAVCGPDDDEAPPEI